MFIITSHAYEGIMSLQPKVVKIGLKKDSSSLGLGQT